MAACGRVLALPVFAEARHVVLYAAFENELDPSMIAERARADGKSLYYPSGRNERPGFLGDGPRCGLPGDMDDVVVFVPGVAFDVRGVRLGRGGGWYDRALATCPAATRLGLGYDFQVLEQLPEDPWDVRMHAIVTDTRLLGGCTPGSRAMKENPS